MASVQKVIGLDLPDSTLEILADVLPVYRRIKAQRLNRLAFLPRREDN